MATSHTNGPAERTSVSTLHGTEDGIPPPNHIVGIGASAGGLEALERLFDRMPVNSGMAFVVVQHLSPSFKSMMDELLSHWTALPIHPAEHGMTVLADRIYLMPPKKEMIISGGRLLLTDRGPSDELTLPIDRFLRSLAEESGDGAVGIVLSGTGSDGSRGVQAIHEAGGLVLVQSEQTAKFNGMPRSALETGVVDLILSPEEMPVALLRHIQHSRPEPAAECDDTAAHGWSALCGMLQQAYGVDFSLYKSSTVTRRTERRLHLKQLADLDAYITRLRHDHDELDALYHDLLIGVTGFFRDDAAFRALQQDVLPELLEPMRPTDEFRAWVAGCATGEEAYSLAMLIHEHYRQRDWPLNVKVFATDVHRTSLNRASIGLYTDDAVATLTPERRARYFTRNGDGYQVLPELRQLVVFAPHNITKDAPFTRLNLISCRNLLIYLEPTAQKKALGLFHFGLKTGGTLFLGPSESTREFASEFETVNQTWRLFRKRRDVRLSPELRLSLPKESTPVRPSGETRTTSRVTDPCLSELFGALLEETLPPSVLINENRRVVHTFGDASRFLRWRKGRPSFDLLDLLADDLRLAAAGAIHRAVREGARVAFTGVRAAADSEESIQLSVRPLSTANGRSAFVLISFEPSSQPAASGDRHDTDLSLADASRDRVEALETELCYTKENLQATIEELEASNEELHAANEEMLASNEELQSTNEELHSVNEELCTVNAEYQSKIAQLTELTHDMDNLLVSTEVHTMFLDERLYIRKFTPKMAEVFNLIPADIGCRIDGFMNNMACEDLPEKLSNVLAHGRTYDEEVSNKAGDQFLMRILPYRGDTERSGVVLTLIDIREMKQAEARFRKAVEAAPCAMVMIDREGSITLVNSETERAFGYARGELLGQPLEILIPDRHRTGHVQHRRQYLQHPRLRPMGTGLELSGQRQDGTEFPVDVRLSPIETARGICVLAAVVDVTDRKRLEFSLRDQVKQRDRFLAVLSHELRNPMAAILNAASLLGRIMDDLPAGQAPCDVIRRQASQMAAILDDLSDVSRVTQGKINLRREVTDLTRLGKEAIEAVGPLLAAHRHHLDLEIADEPLWADVDRSRVLQIIGNLLTNAVKYTPDGGQLSLSLSREGRQAVIRVRDNGRGIPPQLANTIFDMFVQSQDTLDRSEGGMGLGLTLVRSLVALHEGTIEVFSRGDHQGSEFVVRLPLTSKRPPRARQAVNGSAPESLRIVLVEDSDDARQMLEALLTLEGHEVHSAADGWAGLELLLRIKPDVALVDIGLPGMNGCQLARQVLAQLGQDTVRLIALTGFGREEDHEAMLEAGFHEHLLKPVNMDELKATLAKEFGGTRDAK